jgi:hypothetical protein
MSESAVAADTVPEGHVIHVAVPGLEMAVGVVEYATASVPLAPGTAVMVHGYGIDVISIYTGEAATVTVVTRLFATKLLTA